MGNLDQDKRCVAACVLDGQNAMLPIRAFAVPNHLLIATPKRDETCEIVESAHRRGWFVSLCEDFCELPDQTRMVPAGGMLLLDTAIFSDRDGVGRLSQLANLPDLPRTYLLTNELDVNVLAVREISNAAGIEVIDILVRPLNALTLDRLLGT